MKKIFVTYTENGVIKKGLINEDGYNSLKTKNGISNVVVYPSELIMENNYNSLVCPDGKCNNRNILRG